MREIKNRGLWKGSWLCFETLPSTNQWAIEHAETLRHGDVIWALHQTAGRGRFDRTWISPPDSCLTFSFAVKFRDDHDPILKSATQVTALALREALAEKAVDPLLKWPNDVLVDGKKIAGILAESSLEHNLVIVGIGLNTNLSTSELRDTDVLQSVTSLKMQTGQDIDGEPCLSSLLKHLEQRFDSLQNEGASTLPTEWGKHDSLQDRTIRLDLADGSSLTGRYAGLSQDGRLKIDDTQGDTRLFWSGDVTVTPS